MEHWSDVYKAKAAKSSGRNDYNRNKGLRGSGRQRGGHHGGHSKRRRDDNDDGPEVDSRLLLINSGFFIEFTGNNSIRCLWINSVPTAQCNQLTLKFME